VGGGGRLPEENNWENYQKQREELCYAEKDGDFFLVKEGRSIKRNRETWYWKK